MTHAELQCHQQFQCNNYCNIYVEGMLGNMALIFYARVSSKDQNLERQIYRAKQVKANKVFVDKKSGKNIERSGLQEMFNYIREGDTIEIVSLDRLSRNYNDIKKLVQVLKEKKVKIGRAHV